MKRLLLSSLLMLFTTWFVSAQTVNISGTVTDLNNGQPVAGHPVYIMTDSSSGVFFYYNQVTTNNQGFYSDLVPVPANLQVVFYIGTLDCNNDFITQTAIASNGQITADFSI